MPAGTQVAVDAHRLGRWFAGFEQRHGQYRVEPTASGLIAVAADGARAEARAPLLPGAAWPPATQGAELAGPLAAELVGRLAAELAEPRRLAVLLVRRGGYGAAVVDGWKVTASKVGGRHVQGRTAAGGWSQQRFARRREKQTAELAAAAAAVAARVLVPALPAAALVTGGDKALVGAVLADPKLAPLRALPAGPHLAVGDPRAAVVASVPGLLRRVTVHISDSG